MTRSVLPVARPCFDAETRAAISRDIDAILASGQLLEGPFNTRLQEQWQTLTGRRHALSIATCTAALTLACRYWDVRDREVLVPSGSFITDLSCVIEAGGTPVLVDMDPDTLSFDLDDLRRKTTPRTRGIIWVHLTGVIAPTWRAIVDHARSHDLFLIEDAAHAHGAEIDGRPAGSFGDVATFSFYATKVVTAGTGGMAVTDDDGLADFVYSHRSLGKDRASGQVTVMGTDHFMDEIRCCVAHHHTAALPAQVARRRAIAARYADHLRNQPGLRLIDPPAGSRPSYYQFPVFLDPSIDRDALAARLKQAHGIHAKQIYLPTHEEVPFRQFDDGSLTRTEAVLHSSLCLPMWVDLTDAEVDRVAEALIAEVRAAR